LSRGQGQGRRKGKVNSREQRKVKGVVGVDSPETSAMKDCGARTSGMETQTCGKGEQLCGNDGGKGGVETPKFGKGQEKRAQHARF